MCLSQAKHSLGTVNARHTRFGAAVTAGDMTMVINVAGLIVDARGCHAAFTAE
jgi:hypothetical protein